MGLPKLLILLIHSQNTNDLFAPQLLAVNLQSNY